MMGLSLHVWSMPGVQTVGVGAASALVAARQRLDRATNPGRSQAAALKAVSLAQVAKRLNTTDHGWPARSDSCQRRRVLATSYLSLVMAAGAAAAMAETDAETKPVEVQFDGPESCSGANAFFGSLRSRTEHVRWAGADEPHTTLQVRLSRERGRVVGELRVIDDRGQTDTRKVQGASCDDVVQALSLTAALALDPTAVLSAPPAGASADATSAEAEAVAAPAAASPPAPTPVAAARTSPVSASRPAPGSEWSAGLVGLAVLAGSVSPGIGLSARRILGREGIFRPTLGLALVYVRNDVVQSPQDAQVALLGMSATVCPLRLTASVLTVQPCALGLAGWLRATGRQVTHVESVDRSWLSTGMTLRTAVFLGRSFSLELEAGISAVLLRRRFFTTVRDNVVAETPTISPIVGVGLTYSR